MFKSLNQQLASQNGWKTHEHFEPAIRLKPNFAALLERQSQFGTSPAVAHATMDSVTFLGVFQMPAAVACPKCKKKYSLPDKMLGKVVKCSNCTTKFKTPAPRAGQPAKAATNPQAAKAASNARAAEMRKLGIDGPIQRAPDLFDSGVKPRKGEGDPLANHIVGDPGFAQVDLPQQKVEETVDPLADMYANPAIQQEKVSSVPRGTGKKAGKKAGKKKRKKSQGTFASKIWLWIPTIFIPIFILGIVLSFFAPTPAAIIVGIAYGIFSLTGTAIGIWALVETYKVSESVAQLLLSIFVPFYILYFFATNWQPMKDVGYAFIAFICTSIIAGGAFGMVIGAAMASQMQQSGAGF